jgi:prophage DNA circulation protein
MKQFTFRGFICGPLAMVQHNALLLAMDKPGIGTLTHPTLGIFQGVVTAFSSHYSKEAGGVYELDITFTQSVEPVFPGATGNWLSKINLGSLNVFSAASALASINLGAAGALLGTAMSVGGIALSVISALPAIISTWAAVSTQVVRDAKSIASSVTGLGAAFGPYAAGSGQQAPATATPASLQATAAVSRAAATQALDAATEAARTGIPADITAAVCAAPAAVRAAIPEPTDQIRALLTMAQVKPVITAATDPVGLVLAAVQRAGADLCLYATLAELARAAAAYNFTSYNQAAAISSQVAAAISAGIVRAGDSGADEVCQALRVLRADVVAYLADIGAVLAPLQTVTFRAPLPALTVAQRLYRDGSRSDELIRNATPWHPMALPLVMTVPAV